MQPEDNTQCEDDDYLVRMRGLLLDTQNEVDKIIGAAPKVNTNDSYSSYDQGAAAGIKGGHVVKEVMIGMK